MNNKNIIIGTQELAPGAKLHFVGIGGIGMSGIAQIYNAYGYQVQGSDLNNDYTKDLLESVGIAYIVGHAANNIEASISCIVRSSAIKVDNPEIIAATKLGIPIVSRAEGLGALIPLHHNSIAITGTHGKTTTTAMVASLLHQLKTEPTVVNGGLMHNFNNNVLIGGGEIIALESDESDGSFLRLSCATTVITNLEPEHLDYYGSLENLLYKFQEFLGQMRSNHSVVLCVDDPGSRVILAKLLSIKADVQIIPYSLYLGRIDCEEANGDSNEMLHAENIRSDSNGTYFDLTGTIYQRAAFNNLNDVEQSENSASYIVKKITYRNIMIKTYGMHNVSNAIAAVAAVASIYTIDEEKVRAAFLAFSGVKRRFSILGQVNGITVVDDYAHHGTEIVATVAMARAWLEQNVDVSRDGTMLQLSSVEPVHKPKLIAVFQPHRYTRTKDLMDHFATTLAQIDANYLILLPIYASSEEKIKNISSEVMYNKILDLVKERNNNTSTAKILLLHHENDLPKVVADIGQRGDMLLCMGAGSISKIAHDLVKTNLL